MKVSDELMESVLCDELERQVIREMAERISQQIDDELFMWAMEQLDRK